MLDVAIKDFKAKKSRAFMCIIGVMACVLLIGVVNSLLYDMESGLKGDLGTINGKLYFEQNGTNYPPIGSAIPEDLGNQVLNRSEVDQQKSTEALFTNLGGLDAANPVFVVGLTPGKEQAFIQNTTITGSSSLVGQSENAVIVGSEMAKNYNLTVGKTFNVSGNQFKVVGIMKKVGSGWPLTIDSSMIMSLSHAQNVSGMQGIISTVFITPSGQLSADTVENNLKNAYPQYGVYSQKDAQKMIDQNLGELRTFINMISAFIFIVSIILLMNVMMMSVRERTREIGSMRAIGTKKRSIMALIVYESLILSLIGGVIGILLMSPLYNVLLMAMGMTNVSILSFTIPITIVAEVFVIIFVIGTFSGLIPAYLANRISPIEALRYE